MFFECCLKVRENDVSVSKYARKFEENLMREGESKREDERKKTST
jgi:hypothetical protein